MGRLPQPLTGDDLLDLAARAKATREVAADEAFQLGEGVEILAADLEHAHQELARLRAALARTVTKRKPDGPRFIRGADTIDTLVVDVPITGGAR